MALNQPYTEKICTHLIILLGDFFCLVCLVNLGATPDDAQESLLGDSGDHIGSRKQTQVYCIIHSKCPTCCTTTPHPYVIFLVTEFTQRRSYFIIYHSHF